MFVHKSRLDGGRRVGIRAALLCASAAAAAAAALPLGCSQRSSPTRLEETAVPKVQAVVQPGAWTPVAVPYPSGGGVGQIQLLMDGSILANDSVQTTWRRYFPDPVSGYVGGHWETAASSAYSRDYFATGMLRDGRYLICGGERIRLNGTLQSGNRNKCELYDPNVNFPAGQWQNVPDFPGDVADGFAAPRSDGRLVVAPGVGTVMYTFDPLLGNAWVPEATLPTASIPTFNEGSLTLLQNDTILFARNMLTRYTTGSPGSWSSPSSLPAGADSPFGNTYDSTSTAFPPQPPGWRGAMNNSIEGGSALVLYDGRVYIAGSTGHNAIYNPATGFAGKVQDTPGTADSVHKYSQTTNNCPCGTGQVCGQLGKCLVDEGTGTLTTRMDESAQAVMPNGNVLTAAIAWDYLVPWKFYEYAPFDGFTPFTALSGLPNAPSYTGGSNVLQTPLPDGGVLVANNNSANMFIYSHAGPQLTTYGQPTISSITGPVAGVYTMTGTNLNGLTNGANRDDEGQPGTGFPIVWVNTYGQRRYCTVTSVNTASIHPGQAVQLTFKLPPDLPGGSFDVGVSASGLQSSNFVAISNGTPPVLNGQRGLLLLE
jgi:hypothetical protein